MLVRITVGLCLLIFSVSLGGCSLGYYWQAASGQFELMRQRRDLDAVLEDPATTPAVKEKLRLAQDALNFAHQQLHLPDHGSYRQYADLGRPYVVWNVVAAPALSLQPRQWCYPVAGCVSYRGYFSRADAERFAAQQLAGGDDVFVGGVAAYSTLGRFDDPIINTMLDQPDFRLAGLLFHELAHQRLYVRDDPTFNESFASATEREGLLLWLAGDPARCDYLLWLARYAEVNALLEPARAALDALYASEVTDAAKREGKAQIFDQLVSSYASLRASWAGPPYFDGWFSDGLNNARLAALATYDAYVPAFRVLLRDTGGDFEQFFDRAEVLGDLPADERSLAIATLVERSVSDLPAAGTCSAPAPTAVSAGRR